MRKFKENPAKTKDVAEDLTTVAEVEVPGALRFPNAGETLTEVLTAPKAVPVSAQVDEVTPVTAQMAIPAKPVVKAEPREIPVVKVTRYRVMRERTYVEGGFRHILREGSIIDNVGRDIEAIRKQGIPLELLEG